MTKRSLTIFLTRDEVIMQVLPWGHSIYRLTCNSETLGPIYIYIYIFSSQISSGTVTTLLATGTRSSQRFPLMPERIMGMRTSRPSPGVCPECPVNVRRICLRWWTTCVTLCCQSVLNPCTPPERWDGCSRSSTAAAPPPCSTPSSRPSPNTPTVNQQDSTGAEAHGKTNLRLIFYRQQQNPSSETWNLLWRRSNEHLVENIRIILGTLHYCHGGH